MKVRSSAGVFFLGGALAMVLAGCDLVTSAEDPPSTPVGLRASALGASTVLVTWTRGPGGAERVEVERARAGEGFEPLAAIGSRAGRFRDEGLDPATPYRYRIRACGGGGCSAFTAAVQVRTPEDLAVETGALPSGVRGEAYEASLRATGGRGPYTWSEVGGSFPEGLAVTAAGKIYGSPAESGTFDLTVRVTGAGGQRATAVLTVMVFEPLEITTSSLPDARVGEPYGQGLGATGGSGGYVWEVIGGALPGGLSLSTSGFLSGTPDAAGAFAFTVSVASDDGQDASRQLSLTVVDGQFAVRTSLLPPGLVGGPYDVVLEASGGDSSSLSWSLVAGSLPAGLSLEAAGRIQGTPDAAGTSGFTVRVESGDSTATADLTLDVVADDTDAYNVTPLEVAEVPADIRPHVDDALARWERVITGDLGAVAIPAGTFSSSVCAGFGEVINGTSIDDVLVLVNIAEIDGPGNILGQAGPCVVRDPGDLPAVGILILDEADLEPLVGTQNLTDLVFHELGHVAGYGTIWQTKSLLTGAGTDDPLFVGDTAVARWQDLGGSGDVPVENDGGAGTRDAHWEESVFGDEIMTGFAAPAGVAQPLSEVTIGSMGDLGYAVDFGEADPFALSVAAAAARRGREPGAGFDILYRGPVGTIPAGTGRRPE